MMSRKAAEIADISNLKLNFTEKLNMIEACLTDLENKIREQQHATTRRLCATALKDSGDHVGADRVLKTPMD